MDQAVDSVIIFQRQINYHTGILGGQTAANGNIGRRVSSLGLPILHGMAEHFNGF